MSEFWDLYDENRKILSKIHERGKPIPNGNYHLVVNIWVLNNNGKFLITKRHPNKRYGNLWECTGGSVIAGENSIQGALRELEEEIGLKVNSEELILIDSTKLEDRFVDTYILKKHIDINRLSLQEQEVIDVKLITLEEFKKLCNNKLIVPTIVEGWKIYGNKIIVELK